MWCKALVWTAVLGTPPALAGPAPEEAQVQSDRAESWTAFQAAVATKDPAQVAGFVDFPLPGGASMVGRRFGSGPVTREELTAHFDAFFPAPVMQRIAETEPSGLEPIELDGKRALRLMTHTKKHVDGEAIEFSIGLVFQVTDEGYRLVAVQAAG